MGNNTFFCVWYVKIVVQREGSKSSEEAGIGGKDFLEEVTFGFDRVWAGGVVGAREFQVAATD